MKYDGMQLFEIYWYVIILNILYAIIFNIWVCNYMKYIGM